MKKAICLAAVCFMAAGNISMADTIRGIDIDFVNIGNTGNPADTAVMNDGTSDYGSVGYNYRIGKFEITNKQWNLFTAAAGSPAGDDGGYSYGSYWPHDLQPANRVSWYEAAQLCNYLTSGDKSKGVYQFSGNNTNPGSFLGINRSAAALVYGTVYVIPTESEWYKAAYYKPDGSGYSLYSNGTDTEPSPYEFRYDFPGGPPWNCGNGAMEQNGTYDMMGNITEWNETILNSRGFNRGGTYSSYSYVIASTFRGDVFQNNETIYRGFRIASIPEPASLVLLGLGGLLIRKKIAVSK